MTDRAELLRLADALDELIATYGMPGRMNTEREAAAVLRKLAEQEPTRSTLDGCTEDNCTRCRTPPVLRGNMQHAGIGHYPDAPVPKE